jgi:hypothetical protein
MMVLAEAGPVMASSARSAPANGVHALTGILRWIGFCSRKVTPVLEVLLEVPEAVPKNLRVNCLKAETRRIELRIATLLVMINCPSAEPARMGVRVKQ